MSVVNLKYEDLVAGADLTAQIEEAYGPNGIGVLTVSGIPKVLELRQNLLKCAGNFAKLDENTKEKYVDEKSNYSFGWSHGKEVFNNKKDVLKGSYYANPQYDVPTEDQALVAKYPFLLTPNIWPKADMPELEFAFKAMGCLMVEVALLIAKQVDNYINKIYGGEAKNYHKLYDVIKNSKVAKGRLLYYFPMQADQIDAQMKDKNADSWCGWHLDHGSLTGLTNAMYCDENGNVLDNFSDEAAGLHIRTRHGEVIKAKWPSDCLAFQIGESAQIHSGGRVVATPHCVRGTVQPNVSRSTFALFMQPQWDEKMVPPQGKALADCQIDVLEENMDFNGFTAKRIGGYYGKM